MNEPPVPQPRADFDRSESPVGWAKARSSRRARVGTAMVGTLRFAHATLLSGGDGATLAVSLTSALLRCNEGV